MRSFSVRLLASIASYQYHLAGTGLGHKFLAKFARGRHLFWSIMTHSDVDPRAELGLRLRMPHPNGVVIHGDAVIGDDCMIMQQVTIGMIGDGQVPVIGSRVYIGAGAKVIGNVTVGDGARIGANAVVTKDVPRHCTAVGVPARIIEPDTKLRNSR